MSQQSQCWKGHRREQPLPAACLLLALLLAVCSSSVTAMRHITQEAGDGQPSSFAPELACSGGDSAYARLCKVLHFVWVRQIPRALAHRVLPPVDDQAVSAFFMSNSGAQQPLPQLLTHNWLQHSFSLALISVEQARHLCRNQPKLAAPLVFLTRDHANVFHFYWTETMPLFFALAAYGLQNASQVQLVFMDMESHPAKGSSEDRFLPHFMALAGGLLPLTASELPDAVCADTALLGLDHSLFTFGYQRSMEDWEGLAAARRKLTAYKDWLLQRLGWQHLVQHDRRPAAVQQQEAAAEQAAAVQPTAAGAVRLLAADEKPLELLIVDRKGSPFRKVINMGEFERAAETLSQRGGTKVDTRMVDFGELELSEQIAAVAAADVMVGSHGAALAHLIWLPPWGVSVELMPYKFGPYSDQWEELDFYHGYGNWARIAARSHLVWHNRNRRNTRQSPMHGVDEFKYHNSIIPPEQMAGILAAAVQKLRQPVAQRNFGVVQYLNEPTPLCDDPWKQEQT